MSPLRRVLLAGLTLILAASTLACDDPPEACSGPTGPEFTFELDTTAELDFEGVLVEVNLFVDPPVEEYIWRTLGGRRIQMLVPGTGFPLPVAEQETLSVEMVFAGTDPHVSYGLRLEDDQGLRFLAVSDWRPGHSAFAWSPFVDGYDLGGDRLINSFVDGGCDPIQEDTVDFRILRNRKMAFALVSGGRVELFRGETGRIGSWNVHLYKSTELIPKAVDTIQNQFSFFIEREDAR